MIEELAANVVEGPKYHIHKTYMSPSPPVMAGFSSSSSPTFLLPPPTPQLMPIQLTQTNYILWKSLFIPVLKAYNMLNHVQGGGEHCPPQFLSTTDDDEDKEEKEEEKESRCENPAYTSWIQKDQMLLTWINVSLSPKLLRYTRDCTSGQALWLHLEDVLTKSAETHVLRLKARLQNLKLSNIDGYILFEQYLEKAGEIANELEAAGFPISDRELTSHLLEALPEDYEEVVASIRNQPLPVTRNKLYDLLRSHRNILRLKARLRNQKQEVWKGLKNYLGNIEFCASSLKEAGAPINDRELTCIILEGLPECYDELVVSIKNLPHPLTQPELHNLLLSHRFPRPFRHKLANFLVCVICLAPLLGFFVWFTYVFVRYMATGEQVSF